MLSKLLTITACVFLLCLLTITGTRLLAQRDPPPRVAALLPDPSCTSPCWMGFRPGYVEAETVQNWLDSAPMGWQTSRIEIPPDLLGYTHWQIILPDDSMFRVTVVRADRSWQTARISLWPEHLTIGDLIAALGEPDTIDFVMDRDQQKRAVLGYYLYYLKSRIAAKGEIQIEKIFSPGTPVTELVYGPDFWGSPYLGFDWRGFVGVTVYFPRGLFQ